jgi:hypothetical protein
VNDEYNTVLQYNCVVLPVVLVLVTIFLVSNISMAPAGVLRFRWLISLVGVLTLLRQQHTHHNVYFCDSFSPTARYQQYTGSQPHRHRFYNVISRSLPPFDHRHHSFASTVRRRMYTNNGNFDDVDNAEDEDDDHESINYNTTAWTSTATSNSNSNNATVYRNPKKKSSTTKEYKIVDNRDALPFQIQLHTPPDYHTMALRLSDAATVDGTATITSKPSPTKSSTTSNGPKKKTSDAITTTTPTLLSSVYRSNEENDLDSDNNNSKKKSHKKRKTGGHNNTDTDSVLLLQKLGDFVLDASTTTGDTIVLQDNTVYRVIRHRCLYQYKQKQFVMCRKILEVKELNRYLSEQYIAKQFNL